MSKILFQMTGSIAAFKAAALISKLRQLGHEVQVVASPAALQFIGTPTLEGLSGRKVMTELWEEGQAMDHIHAVRWADLILVVPASAHFINRIAQGVGDDLLTTMFLAHDFKKPFLLAPAMNTSMYLHPATQRSIGTLKEWGVEILESASGVLACGEQGYGRLLEPDQLLLEVEGRLMTLPKQTPATTTIPKRTSPAANSPRILITAGGSIEPIDEVRYIGNTATGKTGVDIAQTLSELGADVTLLASETSPAAGPSIKRKNFRSFADLQSVLRQELQQNEFSHVIHTAAVSDYSVDAIRQDGVALSAKKISSGQNISLSLRPNPKLIAQIKEWSKAKDLKLIGFKLTRGLEGEDARTQVEAKVQKLFEQSHADFVVHNDQAKVTHNNGGHVFEIFGQDMKVVTEGQTRLDLIQSLSQLVFQTPQENL